MAAIKSPQSLFFSRLNNSNSFSLSSQEWCSILVIILVASSGLCSKSMSLLCWVPRAGCRVPGGSQQMRGAESPPWPCCPCCFGCSPGQVWLSGLGVHISSLSPSSTPKSFSPGLLFIISQPVLIPGLLHPGAATCTWSC